ncbi:Aldo/keto reductase [Fibrobacter sp. UWB15]|uniref:aldo/keto reductase n=1 Tax=unclassified Fibrobacter TaxID=2634177 RepID=UPI000910E4FA|nr:MULTISPECIES: aldo/keto reductase [unclassified Fibrobacter]PWJ65144.1 diketogulonate reductase-like aldo/keto reductase [Fibrobacter sp. UWB6]SHG07851.1 Aldo/keto reductase [Fibrobacter sp. UWB8]SMG31168.1 Aldo/keto reductase [Fibrobacter sp. UWB15]
MRWFSFLFIFLFMACSSDAASQAVPKVSDKGDSIVQNSKRAAPTVKLNSGFDMPVLGLGTWTLRGKVAEDAVHVAIKNGYRLIDTAKYYDNEEAVGRGIRRAIDDGLVKREDLFVTSKLVPWSNSLDEDIDDSLEKLGLEYIDLMLLHQHGSDAEDKAVYKAMERAVKAKKIRSIGISNYYTEKTAKRFFADFEIKPAVVQNENHVFYQNTEFKEYARRYGAVVESYYPLGGRGHTEDVLGNKVVAKIAKAHEKTAAQVVLRWHVQSGYIAIPGSKNPDHIAENISIFDFELTDDEMKQITALDTGHRYENW